MSTRNRSFRVVEKGKIYKVILRGYYQSSITTEKKFREVIEKSIRKIYGERGWDMHKDTLWENASTLGITASHIQVTKNKLGKWEEVR